MKKLFFSLLCTLFFVHLVGQNYVQRILNRGVIFTNVSLLQDYDGDGDLDIILSQKNPDGLFWLENTPDKQFPMHPIIITGITRIMDVDMADVDNDGRVDYIVSTENSSGSDTDAELVWFQRQANDTYIKWTIDTGKSFWTTAVADFNNDGFADIAVNRPNTTLDGSTKVYLNDSNYFFSSNEIEVPGVRNPIDVADLDDDGDIDIIAGGIGGISNGTGSRTLLNDGAGNFSFGQYLHCLNDDTNNCGSWETIKAVDLNGDEKTDILALCSNGLGPGLYWLDGANNFEQTYLDNGLNDIYLVGDLIVFDIDGNGLNDIIGQSEGEHLLYIYSQVEPLVFQRKKLDLHWDNGGNATAKMAAGDLDDDGDLDLVFPEKGNVDGDVSWFENIGGQLYKHLIIGDLRGARIPKLADFDGDGDLDIFLTTSKNVSTENEIVLYENIGNDEYINWRIHDDLDFAADIEIADIDQDGDLDLFATARDANDLVWLRNDGFEAEWVTDTIDENTNMPLGIVAGDIDGDEDIDVALCSFNDAKVFWYQKNQNNTFQKKIIDSNLPGPLEVEMLDLEGDGDMDFAIVSSDTSVSVSVHINDGNYNFSRQVLHTGQSARDIEVEDWNGDNIPDVIACFFSNSLADGVDVIGFINSGTGNFSPVNITELNERTTSIKSTDLNGDNRPDLVLGEDIFVGNHPIYITYNHENGTTPTTPVVDGINAEILGIDAGDLNNDGFQEIVYTDFQNNNLVILSNVCANLPSLSFNSVPSTCEMSNGSATVSVIKGLGNYTFQWNNGSIDPTIENLSAGNYEVTVTDENNCEIVGSTTVEDLPIIDIELSSTPTNCQNKEGDASFSILNNIGINSILWSNGANTQNISDLTGGIYFVTIVDENNCEITEQVEVESLSPPLIDLGPDLSINAGGNVILTPNVTGNFLTYLWSTGETTDSIIVDMAGTYTVTVTNSDGCSSSDSITITISTETKTSLSFGEYYIFPNPAHDIIRIYLSENINPPYTITLIDTNGKKVLEKKSKTALDHKLFFDVKDLASGHYHIITETISKKGARSFIKQ